MEDGISAIFYIIVSAVIVLITALGKKKKPNQVRSKTGNEESEGTDFFRKLGFNDRDENSEEFVDLPDEEEINEEEQEAQHGISVTRTFEEQSDKEAAETERILMEEEKKSDSEDYEQEVEETDMAEIMEEFDLKKAVIYSEIINRRY